MYVFIFGGGADDYYWGGLGRIIYTMESHNYGVGVNNKYNSQGKKKKVN